MGVHDSGSRGGHRQRRQSDRVGDAVHEQPGLDRHELPGQIPVAEYHSYFHGARWSGHGNPFAGEYDLEWLGSDEWLAYDVDVRDPGPYAVRARVAAADSFGPGRFDIVVDGEPVETVRVETTGGWYSWNDVETTVEFPRGLHTVAVVVRDGGWKLERLECE